MDIIFKIAVVAIISAILVVFVRKHNPEIAILLSTCAIILIFLSSSSLIVCLEDMTDLIKTISAPPDMLISPVFKCLGISLATKISAELCRDTSQAASAAALEFAGTVCAMAVSMPMMISMLKMVTSFV